MSTLIRPEISKRKETWISKHRYYELKHFCLQYPEWKRKINDANYIRSGSIAKTNSSDQIEFKDPVSEAAERICVFQKNIDMVERACFEADTSLKLYLLEALTGGVTYEYLRLVKAIPCSRSSFYKAYRRAFWILDKLKDV